MPQISVNTAFRMLSCATTDLEENEVGSIQAVKAGAPWLTSAEDGKVGWATRSDYAKAVAAEWILFSLN
ncbi:hypothetical protein [Paenibacillus amylolyticus]|uniref:hypothetical protein n=1 Tax=Paenibacillus amylolyticus TaxID=1451 RepID=UPI003D2F638B